MILYEWVYDRGKIAEGVFCSEKCATDMYFDNPHTAYKGGPSALDEQESQELAADWEVCYGCGKSLVCESLQEAAEAAHHSEIEDAGSPAERKEAEKNDASEESRKR